MRKYELQKKEIERKVLIETTCDLCGAVAKRGDWTSSMYEINDVDIEVKIFQKDGRSYPEGGSGTEYRVDMCPDCFIEKLIPWLQSQGCSARRKEWDW